MNCQHFRNRLYEYLDGTLSRWPRSAADRHLARCAWCRVALRQEQQLAQFLAQQLEKSAEPVALRTEVLSRVRTKLSSQGREQIHAGVLSSSWGRLAGAVTLAASLLVATFLLGKFFLSARNPKPNPIPVQSGNVQIPVSIQLSYRIPIYTFRKEGNFVVDALSYGTNVINQTLWVANPKAVGTKQPRKMSL